MARTTLNIDTPILQEIRELQKREQKPLGQLVSELLAEALSRRSRGAPRSAELTWLSQSMEPRVDLADKEALHAAMDRDGS